MIPQPTHLERGAPEHESAPFDRVASLRGSPHRKTNFMEELQKGYTAAVAAAAGCVIWDPHIDDGLDIQLHHKSVQHLLTDHIARLEVQLKATSQLDAIGNGMIKVQMSGERYNELAIENPTIHKIVVIMKVPRLESHWVYARSKGLTIHHCAYWVNLAGKQLVDTKETTVFASLDDVFDDVSLCRIMQRIGSGGAP